MDSTSLIQALQNPNLYDHPVSQFEVVETHLSWVILTGPFAYKIKKSVCFPFADFSTLEKRFFYCQEELRLNQRFAPLLYLGILPISGTLEHPHIGLDLTQPPIEYAIKMVQFDRNFVLARLVQKNSLTLSQLNELAKQISVLHQNAPQSDRHSPYGSPFNIQQAVMDSLSECLVLNTAKSLNPLILHLQAWCNDQLKKFNFLFLKRKKEGFIRECHGDLYLENMVLFNDHVLVFDCIEFNPNLRWIDTINEIAFLTMDLQAKYCPEQAFYFLNRYLELTGDFEGIMLLPFYQVYRAIIRAMVALLSTKPKSLNSFSHYLTLAQSWTQKPKPQLILMQGISGSGKTTLAQNLAPLLQAIVLRSDIERKRLFPADSKSYSPEKTEATYQKLKELSQLILNGGYTTIVDATFLKHSQRENFKTLAQELQIPFIILSCHAPIELVKKRIAQRIKESKDAMGTDLNVLNKQLQQQEPFSTEEQQSVQIIKTDQVIDIKKLARSDIFGH